MVLEFSYRICFFSAFIFPGDPGKFFGVIVFSGQLGSKPIPVSFGAPNASQVVVKIHLISRPGDLENTSGRPPSPKNNEPTGFFRVTFLGVLSDLFRG